MRKFLLPIFLCIICFIGITANAAPLTVDSYLGGTNKLSVLIKEDGSLWMWGANHIVNHGFPDGIGIGDDRKEPNPIKVMDNVSNFCSRDRNLYIVKKDNSLWLVGVNTCPIGAKPTQDWFYTPKWVMNDVRYVSSVESSVLVIKTDGSLWAWGNDKNAISGNGVRTNALNATYIDTPVKICDDAAKVYNSGDEYYVIKEDGSLYAWGDNPSGDGSAIPLTFITDNVRSVSAPVFSYATLILKNDNTLWGIGMEHDKGYGSETKLNPGLTPVKLMDNVLFSYDYTVIKTDRTLWAWGEGNVIPQDNIDPMHLMKDYFTPQKTVLTNVCVTDIGDSFGSFAITPEGKVYCWGYNISDESGVEGSDPYIYSPKYVTDGAKVPGNGDFILGASPWAVPEINCAYDANLTYDGVLINYAKNITRLEFCKLVIKLYSALGLPEVELPATSPFSDTSDVDVLRAYQLGIVNGVGSGLFAPNANVTREQMAKMLFAAVSKVEEPMITNTLDGKFTDASSISPWALEGMRYMNQLGIINGIGNNLISPAQNATREVSILMIYRTFMKMSEVKNIELYDGNYFMLQWAPYPHLYLDISSQSMDNGAPMTIWEKNGGDNQVFRFEKVGEKYRLRPKHSNKALSYIGDVLTQQDVSDFNQLFTLEQLSGGKFKLMTDSGFCIDIIDGKPALTAPSDYDTQTFTLIKP